MHAHFETHRLTMLEATTADRRRITAKTVTSKAQLMAIKPATKEGEEETMLKDHGAGRVETETCRSMQVRYACILTVCVCVCVCARIE